MNWRRSTNGLAQRSLPSAWTPSSTCTRTTRDFLVAGMPMIRGREAISATTTCGSPLLSLLPAPLNLYARGRIFGCGPSRRSCVARTGVRGGQTCMLGVGCGVGSFEGGRCSHPSSCSRLPLSSHRARASSRHFAPISGSEHSRTRPPRLHPRMPSRSGSRSRTAVDDEPGARQRVGICRVTRAPGRATGCSPAPSP